jgi:hypothetical protein
VASEIRRAQRALVSGEAMEIAVPRQQCSHAISRFVKQFATYLACQNDEKSALFYIFGHFMYSIRLLFV